MIVKSKKQAMIEAMPAILCLAQHEGCGSFNLTPQGEVEFCWGDEQRASNDMTYSEEYLVRAAAALIDPLDLRDDSRRLIESALRDPEHHDPRIFSEGDEFRELSKKKKAALIQYAVEGACSAMVPGDLLDNLEGEAGCPASVSRVTAADLSRAKIEVRRRFAAMLESLVEDACLAMTGDDLAGWRANQCRKSEARKRHAGGG